MRCSCSNDGYVWLGKLEKQTSHHWLLWIILAVILIAVAFRNLFPSYIDRWKSAQDYKNMAEDHVTDDSEPDGEYQKFIDQMRKDSVIDTGILYL